jgi:transcriptional regulator with XRE-family HTH domain
MTMSDEHQPSRAAELLSSLGTNREIAEILGKSAGTVGDWKSGRRRPPREVMARIEERWPQVSTELWHAPPRSSAGTPADAGLTPATSDVDGGVSEEDLLATTGAELHAMIQRDLARLRGAEGSRLEIGKRSEVIRRLIAARAALTKSTGQGEITREQILESPAWHDLLAALETDLRVAFSAWPEVAWGIDRAFAAWRRADETVDERARRHMHIGVGLRASIARLVDPVGATSRAEAADAYRLLGLGYPGAPPTAAAAAARDESARIAAHPEFQRIAQLITNAIAPYPDALAAASVALQSVKR